MLKKKISESPTARWAVLGLVSLIMFAGYYLTDAIAPLKSLFEAQLSWDSVDYGIFNSGYGWLNVCLLMLIFGGLLLDKIGARRTGLIATGVMFCGVMIKYWAITEIDSDQIASLSIGSWEVFSMERQVLMASVGFATFAVGYETVGITATKIIVRWFKGKEMALALGLNVAVARFGTGVAMFAPFPIAKYFGINGVASLGAPLLFGLCLLAIGLLAFIVFMVMDRKLDAETEQVGLAEDEKFRFSHIVNILKMRGFWYIAFLCLLFYAGVFPFLKFAPELMTLKYGVDPEFAGLIVLALPFGTILLTPLFGSIYDRRGKGATIMLIGSFLLVLVHVVFTIPAFNSWIVALSMMIMLGIAFSLVPSAMWPSVAKIVPEQNLGTAYAMIFWIQNVGLAGVPAVMGYVLHNHCIIGEVEHSGIKMTEYDYTLPMMIFTGLCCLAVIFSLLLIREDKIKHYGLQQPNIKK